MMKSLLRGHHENDYLCLSFSRWMDPDKHIIMTFSYFFKNELNNLSVCFLIELSPGSILDVVYGNRGEGYSRKTRRYP